MLFRSEIEEWDLLSRSVKDISVKDCIDDTTSIFDGDTFSCSVPSCANQVSFCSALFHFLNKFFCVFCRMQFKECLSEASRECRCRLCDSTLCTSKFSCESRQEIVLSLSFCQDRYWRKYSESVCGQEEDVYKRQSLHCSSIGS